MTKYRILKSSMTGKFKVEKKVGWLFLWQDCGPQIYVEDLGKITSPAIFDRYLDAVQFITKSSPPKKEVWEVLR